MIKNVKKAVVRIVATANVVAILAMLAVGFSDRINPAEHPILATIGLSMPFFILLNVAFVIVWIVLKPTRLYIPLLGFVLCYQPVRTYSPLNISHEVPDSALKIITYNVYNFGMWQDETQPCEIAEYLVNADADIVCLQEFTCDAYRRRVFCERMADTYPYSDTATTAGGKAEMAIYSKHPIIGKEAIKYESVTNLSAAFRLSVGGDTLTVVVNHLESIGLSPEEKSRVGAMVTGSVDRDTLEMESKWLVEKIGSKSAVRAPQADAVAEYLDNHSGESIILVGDFNDSPISYVHRTIAKRLTDCYVASGNGPGISYNRKPFLVRIDNVMCSDHWQPLRCEVDNRILASDHYPVVCWMRRMDN